MILPLALGYAQTLRLVAAWTTIPNALTKTAATANQREAKDFTRIIFAEL